MATQALRDAIEALVDKSSVGDVLDALSDVCMDKSYHIRELWQGESLARSWARDAKRIDQCAGKVEN